MTRRRRILGYAAVGAIVLVVVAWLAAFTAPSVPPPQVTIVHVSDLPVASGPLNAVVFPFQLAPDAASDEDAPLVVDSASLSMTLAVPACQSTSAGSCPGVYVEVVTSDQVGTLPTPGNSTPIWCTNSSGTCAPTMGGTYHVDLTAFAGQPLDLVVWSGAGTEWANVAADGTWS